jgi:hypothetical protein
VTRAALVILALLAQAPATAPAPQAPLDLSALLQRASHWTLRFEASLSGLLFRERYVQTWVDRGSRKSELEANVFLIKPSADSRFVLYRDVYRANGRNVTDHTDRLQKLLTENSKRSMNEARRLADASAQYNEGSRRINVNVPTMPLAYLAPFRVGGLRLRGDVAATETIRGLEVVVVEFTETARPTLVRDEKGQNIPANGKYWIHPGSGAVMRAYVELAGRGYMEVDYALHETLKVWVPISMTEEIQSVTGKAEYDRFQRVEVTTGEISK